MLTFQFLAVLAARLFTGVAIYINFAEHPARIKCRTAVATDVATYLKLLVLVTVQIGYNFLNTSNQFGFGAR
jgi:hypothetical protein